MSVVVPAHCPGCASLLPVSLPGDLSNTYIVCKHCGAVSVAHVTLRPAASVRARSGRPGDTLGSADITVEAGYLEVTKKLTPRPNYTKE